MLLTELGSVLREARKARKLTLQQLASRVGVHFTTLSALERGVISELGVRKILRIAEALGLELVLRPGGQRYTLDDLAKERAEGVVRMAPDIYRPMTQEYLLGRIGMDPDAAHRIKGAQRKGLGNNQKNIRQSTAKNLAAERLIDRVLKSRS